MIIADLPCLAVITDHDQVIGGKKIKFIDFKKLCGDKSMASALVYAEGDEVWTSHETSVYRDGGMTKQENSTQSFAQA
jgi:hypothetical protein